jgi:uncharacterized protein YndB with AHSA1/START domain
MIEKTSDREIVIIRRFDAPRELVWDAMTDPTKVVNWWGPRGFTTTIEVMDVRPGGIWKHVMRGPDGTEYPNKSVFKEVTKPERIVYNHGGARKGGPAVSFESTWTFDTVEENQTEVTIRMVFPTAADREMIVKEYGAIEGGKQTLARLGEQLAKTPVVLERTFDAPAGVVWKALTDINEMKQWYFENLTAFKPEVGFETEFNVHHDGRDYPHIWKVTEVSVGKKITYSWKFGGSPGESFLTMELFPEGDKTRLKLTHAGLETFSPEANPQYARKNFVAGWTYFMGTGLKDFLERNVPMPDRDFVISREFDAPRELVWEAWTNPKHMAQWWGPHDFTNPVCEMELRAGGAYRIVMRGPEGTEYPGKGVFREIVKPERLVMTSDHSELPVEWHDIVNPSRDKSKPPQLDSVMTITFENVGGKTKLTVRSRFESMAIRDSMVKMGMNGGWSQSLERLTALLKKM